MDILHFLKSHHDAIRDACSSVATAAKDPKVELEALIYAVQGYMNLEKDYLYPEIAGLFVGAESLVASGSASASIVEKRLKALIKVLPKGGATTAWQSPLQLLQEALLKHFEQEEQLLMPKMRLLIRTEDREDLGQVFVDVEAEVLAGVLNSVKKSDVHGSRKRA